MTNPFKKAKDQELPKNPTKKDRRQNFLFTFENEQTFDGSKSFRASTDADCARKHYMRKSSGGVVRQGDMWGKFNMAVGTTIHDWFYELLSMTGLEYVTEYEYDQEIDGVRFHGFVDTICKDPQTGELFVWDIKSAGSVPKQVYKSHRHQIAVYSVFTGIDDLGIVVIPRTNPKKLEIKRLPKKQAYVDATLRIMAQAIVADNYDLLPPVGPYISSKSDCQWCHFNEWCWNYDDILDTSHEFDKGAQTLVDEVIHKLLHVKDNNRKLILSLWDEMARKEREQVQQDLRERKP